jgi:hypothetical protein
MWSIHDMEILNNLEWKALIVDEGWRLQPQKTYHHFSWLNSAILLLLLSETPKVYAIFYAIPIKWLCMPYKISIYFGVLDKFFCLVQVERKLYDSITTTQILNVLNYLLLLELAMFCWTCLLWWQHFLVIDIRTHFGLFLFGCHSFWF